MSSEKVFIVGVIVSIFSVMFLSSVSFANGVSAPEAQQNCCCAMTSGEGKCTADVITWEGYGSCMAWASVRNPYACSSAMTACGMPSCITPPPVVDDSNYQKQNNIIKNKIQDDVYNDSGMSAYKKMFVRMWIADLRM